MGVLAAAVAIAMVFLGKCMPGLGLGGGAASTPAPAAPAASKPESAGATATRIVVDGERCAVDGGPPGPCEAACRSVAAGARVELDGTLGTHATVDGLRKCLTEAGVRDVLVRAE